MRKAKFSRGALSPRVERPGNGASEDAVHNQQFHWSSVQEEVAVRRYLSSGLHGFLGAVVVVVFMLANTAVAEKSGLEGTYRLISRQLPDGTIKSSPDVLGLLSFTKTHRNLQVVWKAANGILCSYSLASTYSFTPAKYTEKILFTSLNDYTTGQKIAFDLVKRNQTVQIISAAEIDPAKTPFEPPTMVIDGNRIITTAEGMFIDEWERIEDNASAQAVNPE
jgi:hypothetical protein